MNKNKQKLNCSNFNRVLVIYCISDTSLTNEPCTHIRERFSQLSICHSHRRLACDGISFTFFKFVTKKNIYFCWEISLHFRLPFEARVRCVYFFFCAVCVSQPFWFSSLFFSWNMLYEFFFLFSVCCCRMEAQAKAEAHTRRSRVDGYIYIHIFSVCFVLTKFSVCHIQFSYLKQNNLIFEKNYYGMCYCWIKQLKV